MQHFKGRKRFGIKFLKPHHISWIISEQTLKKQTGLSLKERVKHFLREFPASKMNYTLLSKVYKLHNVKRRRIKWEKKAREQSDGNYSRDKTKMIRALRKAR